jgi:hypothetical protein
MSMGTPETVQNREGYSRTDDGVRSRDDEAQDRDRVSQDRDRVHDDDLSDDEARQLTELQEKKNRQHTRETEPSDDNFSHYVHLADGRTVKALSGAGTTYSEGAGTQDDPERFTRIVGIYEK